MKKQKAMLIDVLYNQILSNEKEKEQFKKEFDVNEKTFEKMVKKILDMWLDSPDIIMFLSEMFGIYPVEEEKEGDENHDYLG